MTTNMYDRIQGDLANQPATAPQSPNKTPQPKQAKPLGTCSTRRPTVHKKRVQAPVLSTVVQDIPCVSGMQGLDQDIIDNPPDPTYYNSYDGTCVLYGQVYHHGEIGPDGTPVYCPILTDEDRAARYEKYPIKDKIWNDAKQRYDSKTTVPITKLNAADLKIMNFLNTNDRVIILAYRGIRKSVNLTRRVERCILDLHLTVVYYADTATHAEEFSATIRQDFKKNAMILRDYGYVIDEEQQDRSTGMFFVWQSKNEDSLRKAGLCIGSLEGLGQMGGHPDVIALDDVVNEKCRGSDTVNKNAQDWFNRQMEPMAMSHTFIYIVGTSKDPNDLYSYIRGTETYTEEIIPAIYEWPNTNQFEAADAGNLDQKWFYVRYKGPKDSKPLIKGIGGLHGGRVSFDEFNRKEWLVAGRVQYYLDNDETKGWDNTRMALQEFLLIRRRIGIEAFESEYQMKSVKVTGNLLDIGRIKFFNWETNPNQEHIKLRIVGFFDQSLGVSRSADNNAVAIVACYLDIFYIIDLFIWNNVLDDIGQEKINKLEEMYKLYPTIQLMGVERDMAQSGDAKRIVSHFEAKGYNVKAYLQRHLDTVEDDDDERGQVILDFGDMKVKPNKKSKINRIYNQFSNRLMGDRIRIREGINDVAWNEFLAERAFPFSDHVDELDAIGSAMDIAQTWSFEPNFDGGKEASIAARYN